MSKKMTKLFATFAVSGVIIGAGIVPANAATIYYDNCKVDNNGVTWVKKCWTDYNWFEELFQGRKDGYKPVAIGVVQ